MPTLFLDGVRWQSAEYFDNAVLVTVGDPSWRGHNLDALNDSIGGDDINTVKLPYDIVVHGTSRMSEPTLAMVKRFRELMEDLRSAGKNVDIELQE